MNREKFEKYFNENQDWFIKNVNEAKQWLKKKKIFSLKTSFIDKIKNFNCNVIDYGKKYFCERYAEKLIKIDEKYSDLFPELMKDKYFAKNF